MEEKRLEKMKEFNEKLKALEVICINSSNEDVEMFTDYGKGVLAGMNFVIKILNEKEENKTPQCDD